MCKIFDVQLKLSWKNHIDSIALKFSKTIGLLSKLIYFVPHHTLINIYNSLITPYFFIFIFFSYWRLQQFILVSIYIYDCLKSIFCAGLVRTQILHFVLTSSKQQSIQKYKIRYVGYKRVKTQGKEKNENDSQQENKRLWTDQFEIFIFFFFASLLMQVSIELP